MHHPKKSGKTRSTCEFALTAKGECLRPSPHFGRMSNGRFGPPPYAHCKSWRPWGAFYSEDALGKVSTVTRT
jgi:hypothetical protein